jgi:hypothetical protein
MRYPLGRGDIEFPRSCFFLYDSYVQIRRRFRLTLSSRTKRRNGQRETRDALKTVEEEVEEVEEVEVEEVEEEK